MFFSVLFSLFCSFDKRRSGKIVFRLHLSTFCHDMQPKSASAAASDYMTGLRAHFIPLLENFRLLLSMRACMIGYIQSFARRGAQATLKEE